MKNTLEGPLRMIQMLFTILVLTYRPGKRFKQNWDFNIFYQNVCKYVFLVCVTVLLGGGIFP